MTYEHFIDKAAHATFHGSALFLEDEDMKLLQTAYKERGRDNVRNDIMNLVKKYQEEANRHRENNTPEYQEALKKYSSAVEVMAEKYAHSLGIPLEISDVLHDVKDYGIDIDNFAVDVSNVYKNKFKTKYLASVEERYNNLDKELAFDAIMKYGDYETASLFQENHSGRTK